MSVTSGSPCSQLIGLALALVFVALGAGCAIERGEIIFAGELGDSPHSPLEGSWEIVRLPEGRHMLRLHRNFKATPGPDLKIFFSTLLVEQTNHFNAGGSNNSIKIAPLKQFSGRQEYLLPPDLDLAQYQSWIIHCEAHSHFWDGADLTVVE